MPAFMLPAMKTLGLIGGMSWESTAIYYRLMNEMVRERLGGLHSAPLLVWSFDFAEIAALQADADWQAAEEKLIDAAQALKAAGAQALVICTNTMHKMADEVETATGLPVLHIADATATAIKRAKLDKVGLLATRFTMEQEFYKGRLTNRHGIEAMIPGEQERVDIHRIIYNELCKGIVSADSRKHYLDIIGGLKESGAQGIILGCTEIGLLIEQKHTPLPVFDTTSLHAQAAVDWALS
jgi:aspartate racemase